MLKVERLTKTYPTAAGPLTVLHEISFELAAGTSLAVVGPSGSGKTTLLGLCAGLDRATAGSVTLAGKLLDDLNEDGRAQVRNLHVGFVFQNYQLIPTLTALENVLVPMELRSGGGAASARPRKGEPGSADPGRAGPTIPSLSGAIVRRRTAAGGFGARLH